MTAALTSVSSVLGAIAFDPHIRGVLVVLAIVLATIGGVYLVLSTDLGARLGILVMITGFCGWMFVMGAVWTMYGIGLVGERPAWEVVETNVGDLGQAQNDEVRALPNAEDLPEPADILAADPEIADAFEEGDDPSIGDIYATVDDDVVDAAIESLTGAPVDEVFGGWEVIPSTEVGDPQAEADVELTGAAVPLFEAATDYVVLGGFEIGGKPERSSDAVVDRVANKVTNTVRATHPTHYAVVQVQRSLPTEVPEGAAPLSPEPDPDAPVISVLLVRNLGNLRLPTFLLTVVFGVLFSVSAWVLHQRDKEIQRLRAEGLAG
jgi:hypothetical protein